MSNLLEMKSLFEKVFDSFKKVTPALIAIAIATGSILFLPDIVLAKMSLVNLQDQWRRIIGITFVVSVTLILTILLIGIFEEIKRRLSIKLFLKRKRQQFINLPLDYKTVLITLLLSEDRSIPLDPTSGNTMYLLSNQFIHQMQSYTFFSAGYTAPMIYAPEAWLIDLFNKEPELFVI